MPVALVSLVDYQRQFFAGQVGLAEPWAANRATPLSHSFCRVVVASAQPLVVEDARDHPAVTGNSVSVDLGVVAYAGFPLADVHGRVLGLLCAIDHELRRWAKRTLRRCLTSDLARLLLGRRRRFAPRLGAAPPSCWSGSTRVCRARPGLLSEMGGPAGGRCGAGSGAAEPKRMVDGGRRRSQAAPGAAGRETESA